MHPVAFASRGFTGTRRADHQDAFPDFTAQLLERLGSHPGIQQFRRFFFRFVTTRDVSKRGFDLIFRPRRTRLLLPNDMAPLPPPPI